MELNASGIAATAKATANKKAFPTDSPRKTLIPNKMPQKIKMAIDSFFPKESSEVCSGVRFADVLCKRFAILPTSVCMPMSVMTISPRPLVMKLPEKTIFLRSPRAACSEIASMILSELRLSPVNVLSSIFKPAHSMIRPSAGTTSPASKRTISPGTSSLAGSCTTVPLRRTEAFGADKFFRLFKERSACRVCIVPRMAFNVITIRITAALSVSPSSPDMTAAIMRMMTRKS